MTLQEQIIKHNPTWTVSPIRYNFDNEPLKICDNELEYSKQILDMLEKFKTNPNYGKIYVQVYNEDGKPIMRVFPK